MSLEGESTTLQKWPPLLRTTTDDPISCFLFLPFKDIFNQPKLISTDGTGIEKSQLECQKVGGLTVPTSILGNLTVIRSQFGYSVRETLLLGYFGLLSQVLRSLDIDSVQSVACFC